MRRNNLKIMSLLVRAVAKRRESALLWQLFQSNQWMARLARMNFDQVLESRNIRVSPALLNQAKTAAHSDRKLTIGQFLDRKIREK